MRMDPVTTTRCRRQLARALPFVGRAALSAAASLALRDVAYLLLGPHPAEAVGAAVLVVVAVVFGQRG